MYINCCKQLFANKTLNAFFYKLRLIIIHEKFKMIQGFLMFLVQILSFSRFLICKKNNQLKG